MKKPSSIHLLIAGILLLGLQGINAQYTIPPKMNWWYEARFGMFIHFGSYSYLGRGEWAFSGDGYTKTKYQTEVSSKFNPVNFNAGTIARLAKKIGMKYLVITAKHHEGFCMWKTNAQSFKDVTGTKIYDLPDFTSFKTRDVLKELKDSCDAQGIKFGLFYSILDWNHPSQTFAGGTGLTTMSSMTARTDYIKDMKAQLAELVTMYHPAVLWFDGEWTYNEGAPTLSKWWTRSDGIDLYNYMIGLDSNLIVNERIFRERGLGDFQCSEQTLPATPLPRPWEACQTMNGSWGYNAGDTYYKSASTLIRALVQIVSLDGNYLLNIGPKGDGTVPDQVTAIANGFEGWMSIYSQGIYGTTRSPFATKPKWGYFTKKSGRLYTHVFTWPSNGQIKIPYIANKINKVYLANDSTTALTFTNGSDSITITIPAKVPNAINSVIVLDVAGVPSITPTGTAPSVAAHSATSKVLIKALSHNGKLYVNQNENVPIDITVFSINGRQTKHLTSNERSTSVDISRLPVGIYSLQARNRTGVYTQTFLKKN